MIFNNKLMTDEQLKAANMANIPWVDKYRPNRLGNIVHQTELMKTLTNILKTGEMPHLLFHGPPGTGKTTTVLALANELFGPKKFKERVLELNASDDRGISAVRNEIITFARTVVGNPDPNYKSPPYKILILDEADAMTPDAQSALRKVMEETSAITRFCLICNYVDKIIDPIISRCMQFRFMAINHDTMKRRLKYIAKREDLLLDDIIFDTVINVVDGDLRKGIMLLQNIKYIYKITKKVTPDDVNDLVGYVPQNQVIKLFKECKIKNNKNIIDIAQNFYSLGFPIGNLCEQLNNILLKDETINDTTKAKIFIKLANTCDKLNDGSSELLQLIKILMFINSQFS